MTFLARESPGRPVHTFLLKRVYRGVCAFQTPRHLIAAPPSWPARSRRDSLFRWRAPGKLHRIQFLRRFARSDLPSLVDDT